MDLLRTCIGCGQSDTDPRHVIALPGDVEVTWHLDCHKIAGCASCADQLGDTEGLTGGDLRAHLQKGA